MESGGWGSGEGGRRVVSERDPAFGGRGGHGRRSRSGGGGPGPGFRFALLLAVILLVIVGAAELTSRSEGAGAFIRLVGATVAVVGGWAAFRSPASEAGDHAGGFALRVVGLLIAGVGLYILFSNIRAA